MDMDLNTKELLIHSVLPGIMMSSTEMLKSKYLSEEELDHLDKIYQNAWSEDYNLSLYELQLFLKVLNNKAATEEVIDAMTNNTLENDAAEEIVNRYHTSEIDSAIPVVRRYVETMKHLDKEHGTGEQNEIGEI